MFHSSLMRLLLFEIRFRPTWLLSKYNSNQYLIRPSESLVHVPLFGDSNSRILLTVISMFSTDYVCVHTSSRHPKTP